MLTARARVDSREAAVAVVLVARARWQQGRKGEVVRFWMYFEDRREFAGRLDGSGMGEESRVASRVLS